MMLKILRRKPRAPMTPGQRYKNDLANLFGCGMMDWMLAVCLAAVVIKAAIEEGLPTVADRVFLVLGCHRLHRLWPTWVYGQPSDREV